ncbi:hypothetical protein [Alcanivorax sp.]|uniref:hypothetical protein n=1 Tax=Alcanivorax sp. TaxID=1872427 RepID=UPI000C118055|nr:hypothetical protein [Alcanivorax sp.]PHR68514.1 MAG: hypothetical protein COA55_00405 [Alcanivorax sp.]
MAKQWSEIRTERPAGPLTGAEITVAAQGGQTVGLTYQQLKDWVKFKNNLSATTSPAANDDSTAGYEAGSRWLDNTPTPKVWWICTDATAGAAVWDVLSLSVDELGSAALVNTGTGASDVPLNSDLGSAAYSNMAELPFSNIIAQAGRFTTPAGPFDLYATGLFDSDVSDSLSPYNGATVTEVGKFIHDNADFGGGGASLTAPTLDLLSAMGRAGSNGRYGVEFYIAEYAAGGGTGGASLFPSGTLYLMSINLSRAIFAASGRCTFTAWVRAVDGPIGFRSLGPIVTEFDGVAQGTNPELVPADGWTFVRVVSQISTGYVAAWPGISGQSSVSKAQIAIPAIFPGNVDAGIYSAPIPNAGTF